MSEHLNTYLTHWELSQPELLATTPTSHVYTVRKNGAAAVLKLLTPYGWEERAGAVALRHWDGHGAIRLYEADENAQLVEYVEGDDLVTLVQRGDDAEATRIIAEVINHLHGVPLGGAGEGLFPLERWFQELFRKAEADTAAGGVSIFVRGARVAEALLAEPRDIRVLHGDIHHANIRHSAERGWLAFDPKGLVGERTYDLANTLCNPYRGTPRFDPLVHNQRRLLRNAGILAEATGIDLGRVLAFAFAYGCLSASWTLSDNANDPSGAAQWALRIAEMVEPHIQV
jgi:streptomycin 6-kinase